MSTRCVVESHAWFALATSERKIGPHYQPRQRNFVVFVTFTIVARVLEGARDKILQLRVGQWLRLTSGHYGSGRTGDWTPPPATTEELCRFGYFRDLFSLVAPSLEGARDHSYEWAKGDILPVSTIEARGRKIGRHYQPKQRNFELLTWGSLAAFNIAIE
jgi:hypothetical protein